MKSVSLGKDEYGWETFKLVPETEEEKQEMEEDRRWWKEHGCHCKQQRVGWYFVGDGVEDECPKHHWRCEECNGIVQIG